MRDRSNDELSTAYRAYIECLNAQDWTNLGNFVADDVRHNGQTLGVDGYRRMLERDYREIPDLFFKIELIAVDPPYVVCRLRFDCTPRGEFLGLPVNGRKVSFAEAVFYEYRDGKIAEVRSILDKAAVEAQMSVS